MSSLRRHACLLCLAAALFAPGSVAGQRRAEFEIERRLATLSRIEVYDGAVPVLRAERALDGAALQRGAIRAPGSVIGLDGWTSAFFEDRTDTTEWGVALELGRGVAMVGGSVERSMEERFAGGYVKLRWPNFEIAAGGGDRSGDLIGHGAIYVKGARWSAAYGGARGARGVDFQHLAATWHPTQRGGAPGARFISERRSVDRWAAELMFTDRAAFNHFTVWGQFGIAEWPHRKTFETADDITRYVRPPIFLHGYTLGAVAASVRYQRTLSVRELTLDGRVFPVRALRGGMAPAGSEVRGGPGGYVLDRVLPSIMIGAFRRTKARTTTWVGEIGLPPFSLFVEAPTQAGARTYLFVQYRQGF